LGKLEGHGGHIRLAGDWLELNLAEDGWVLRENVEERLASQGTLLEGASQNRWGWDTGKLNRPLLDGERLGKTGLDHLLGDAELGGLLLNNVHHASWLDQEGDALVQLRDWGWDDNLTWAPGGLTDEFFLEGSWESRAAHKAGFGSRLVQHEREGSQAWPQDAHAWGLQVSGALAIHVTTKADSAGLQELWGNNLNHRSIGQNLQALLWNVDKDNIVLEVLDNEQNLALRGLLDELLTNSWEGNWLTINQDLHGASNRNNLDLSDTSQDLDNLLLGLNSPGGNGDWDVLGSIQKKDMLTVIDWVLNSHVVKGADISWLNTAGGWNVGTSKLKGSDLNWGPQGGGWEDKPSVAHQTQILHDNFPGWGDDLGHSDQLGDMVGTSLDNQNSLSSRDDAFTFNVTQEEGLGDTIQQAQESSLSPGLWSLDGKPDLVKGGSLVTNNGADWGEQFLVLLFNQALLELWRLADLPLQLLGLFKLGNNLDALHLARLSKEKLTLETSLQSLLNHLLDIPPVHELWQLNLSFITEAISASTDWRNINSNHVGWGDSHRLLAQNNNSLDLLQFGARGALGHSSDLNNIGLFQLGEDGLDLGELGGDLVLADHLLGEGVHHSLGGEPQDNVEFLGLRLGWEVLEGERGHPGRRWEDANWEDGEGSVLDDLLDVGEHVNKLGIRLVLDAGRDTQGLSNFHGDWLPIDARDNPLQLSGMGEWSDSKEVVLESVWQNKSMDLGNKSRTLNLGWDPN